MSNVFVHGHIQEDNVLTDRVSVCDICGQSHDTNDCQFLRNVQYVSDTPVISRARQTLPKNLEIVCMADGTTTVITKADLEKGTSFGPLYARITYALNPLSDFPIKVFGKTESEAYYLDFSNENHSNWMCFIAPATNEKEQNLVCYQVKQDIYYTTMRTISAGEEMRVWYAPYYAFKMKMPLYNKSFAIYNDVIFSESDQLQINKVQRMKQCENDQTMLLSKEIAEELANKLPAQHLGAANDTEIWNCKFCLTTTKSVVSYAKHLMQHYKPLLGIFCNICNKKCNNATVLERHKKAKHSQLNADPQAGVLLKVSDTEYEMLDDKKSVLDKYKPDKKITDSILEVCAFTNEKEHKSGLSLLDPNLLSVSDLLQNDRCLNINLELGTAAESIVPDNAVNPIKLNIEELVPDLLDSVNEKLNNLDCDICDKKFDKVDYLYRHLRKHTGEFICPSCLVVFARKENLLSHACLSKNLEYNYECSFCQKLFSQKKYLKRHMAKHSEVTNCKWCNHVFSSTAESAEHKCTAPHYTCEECKKRFVHKAHLNRHVKLHSNPKPVRKRIAKRKDQTRSAICEKCGDIFTNPYSLKQHLHTHGERMFECDICHSRFHRMAVLKEHKTIHQSPQIPCNICGKRLKSKKALDIHMLLHGNKKYQCDKCDKSFFQKCNYLKHYRHMHGDKITHNCPHCTMIFTNKQSFDKHIAHHVKPTQYSCALCKKSFHKEYQLKRHVQTSHSGIIYRCPFCHMTARHRHSMRRHFERQHGTLKENWDKIGFINQLAEKSPQFVMEQINVPQQYNTPDDTYIDGDSNEFKDININQETPDFCTVENQHVVTQNLQDTNDRNGSSENEQIITLIQSSEEDQSIPTKNTDLSLNEVPQLNIAEASGNVNDSVLRSAYIYDDDGGDIMFYVLE